MKMVIFYALMFIPVIMRGQDLVTSKFILSGDNTTIVFSLTNKSNNPIIVYGVKIATGEDVSYCYITYNDGDGLKHDIINLCNGEHSILVKPSETYTYKINVESYIGIVKAKCYLKYLIITNNKGENVYWKKTIEFH